MGTVWGSRRLTPVVALALALTGCSAADYSKSITTFADATVAADSALNDLNKSAADGYAALLTRRAVSESKIAVLAGKDECLPDSDRCRIVFEDPKSPKETQQFPADPPLANLVAVMGDIRAYAQNLAALVADNSATEAEASVNAALGSVQALANTLTEKQGETKKTVPNFATPAGAAVNWLIGQYADHVKLAGLKMATQEADPVIQRATVLFQDAVLFAGDIKRTELTNVVQARIDEYSDDRGNAAKLNAAVEAAKTYDDFLLSKPGETFKKMGEAHAALTDALNKPGAPWPQVIAKIQSFAAQAEQLAKIVKDLIALAHPPKEGTK